jgi:hypothetical protein
MPMPVDDEGPVSAGRYPIRIGSFWAIAGLAMLLARNRRRWGFER